MKNYVIINGVSSKTINGLGINELPPITKPSMRVQQEEIDGRDGDITTNLGYSAYDKTITIGLFGTGYDIDDIVAFFNGEGTIVFSNEPDKYYNYKIISQIDYVALQKFKTASITFHCQPFKYPLEETPLEIEYSYLEAEGEGNITIENTVSSTMQVNLLGNTSQTGTPTPSSPIPINVVSGDNTIVSTGKNLLDNSKIVKGRLDNGNIGYASDTPALSYTNDSFSFTTTENYRGATTDFIERKTGDFVVIRGITSGNTATPIVSFYDENKTFITDKNIATQDYGWRASNDVSNAVYIRIYFALNTAGSCTITNPMVEFGSTASTYEPYTSTSYPIHLGEHWLGWIGDYKDRFFKNIPNTTDYNSDLEDNEWYLEKKIGKVVLDGSEAWALNSSSEDSYRYWMRGSDFTNIFVNSLGGSETQLNGLLLCNYFSQTEFSSTGIGKFSISNTSTVKWFLLNTTQTALSDFKSWLETKYNNGNPVTVCYPLANPTYTPITGALKDELEAVWRANSYKGQTNISQVNNDLAFNMNVKAMEEGSNEAVVNNIGNVYSKPLLALEGNGTIDIYLDDTQILKANVEDKMNIDISTLEAYNPDTSALLNRQVIGNYNSMTLQPGDNTIRMDGALTKATITNYTRWL